MVTYRPIEGFPGYRVSSDGFVWSCRKQISLKGHQGFKTIFTDEWRLVHGSKVYGYEYVNLTNGSLRINRRVHVLILKSFVGPRPVGMQSRHHNGIRSDNRIENLSWATPKENNADKIVHGTRQCGIRGPSAKLTEKQVVEIRTFKGLEKSRVVARRFNVTRGCIDGIWRGRTWSHLITKEQAKLDFERLYPEETQ